ncbi:hypothetical protein FACS1894124_3900 [Spirochaetia bacterium]|nr:hypothetical protein FACS1894124_3900 [Spirochaetia bacterium]
MEKKKILLVAVSVGIFLVIAIGASILIFSPRQSNAVAVERPIRPGQAGLSGFGGQAGTAAEIVPVYPVQGRSQPATMDPADMVRSEVIQGLQSSPDMAEPENMYHINSDIPNLPYQNERSDTNGKIVINVPQPLVVTAPLAGLPQSSGGSSADKSSGGIQEPRPQTVSPAATAAANTAAKNSNTTPPAKTAAPAKPAATASPAAAKTTVAAKPAPAPSKTYDAYWVQAGSFSTKIRADGAKETLASKGITSIIENRDVEGKTFYRVRIGPYTSRNEADYWLALIQSLSGFEESQVWKSQAVR